jgi:hypothetical protein
VLISSKTGTCLVAYALELLLLRAAIIAFVAMLRALVHSRIKSRPGNWKPYT